MSSESDTRSLSLLHYLTKHEQKVVLKASNVQIHDLLHLESVFAHLVQENLLTLREQEDLHSSNSRLTDEEKISRLLSSLPKKGSDALQRFLKCLRNTADGTAHVELADFIQEQANEIEKDPTGQESGYCSDRVWTIFKLVIVCLPLVYFIFPTIKYYFNLIHHSKTLPYPSEHFVGRELEVQELLDLVDFSISNTRIVNIVGSPGFGKSTLAIHVGHKMVENGVIVHYVNMAEFSESEQIQLVLAEKILKSAEISAKHVTFERVLEWARDRWIWNHLLILDNCDDVLHRDQKEIFEEAVGSLIKESQRVKVLTTSRKVMMYIEYFAQYKLYELSTKAACMLLESKIPKSVNLTEQKMESIAELTGNVPLALQVVGSVLSLPDPPTPNEIIKKLSEKPMKLLSPKELSKKKQVFASINLSYGYLSQKLKMFGEIIANFPGSFHEEDLYKVQIFFSYGAMANEIETELIVIDTQDSVTSLVQRSLLFYDRRANRYHYHRLIKEFFLEVQRNRRDTNSNDGLRISKFISSFLMCFAQKLLHAADEFQKDPVKSLLVIDTERHNINAMYEYFTTIHTFKMFLIYNYNDNMESVVTAVAAFSIAESVGLLHCRFTSQELRLILTSILDHLHSSYLDYQFYTNSMISKPIISREVFYGHYVTLLERLAVLEEQFNGVGAALQVCLMHKKVVELLKPQQAGSLHYIHFFSTLAHYHSIKGQHAEAIECHSKVIAESEHHISRCQPNECKYYDLGLIYYSIGKKSKAISLLEMSLKLEEHDILSKVELLTKLYLLHDDNGNCETATYTLGMLITHCKEIPKISDIELYQKISSTTLAITLLRQIGMYKEAVELEERLLQVVKEIGLSAQTAVSLESAYEIAQHLYDAKNYTKTIELIEFILKDINQTDHDVIPNMKLLCGKAKFHAGNYTAGLDDIEAMFTEFLSSHTNTNMEDYDSACWYLVLRIKYINRCYRLDRQLIHLTGILLKIVFGQSLDVYATPPVFTTDQDVETQLPISTVPELSFQSRSTELAKVLTGNEITSFIEEQLSLSFRSLLEYLSLRVHSILTETSAFMKMLNYQCLLQPIIYNPVIRAIHNVIKIWLRLYLIYFTWKAFRNCKHVMGIIYYDVGIICKIITQYFFYGMKWQQILLWLIIITDPRFCEDIGHDDFVRDFNSLDRIQCEN